MKKGSRPHRRRWLRWGLIGILVLGSGVATLAWRTPRMVERRLDQDDVRHKIAESIARRLKLKVGIEPLHWTGLHASSEAVVMIGEPPRSLTEMHAHHLEADGSLGEILQGKYRIETLKVEHVEMAFGEAAQSKLSDPISPQPELELPADHPPVLKTELIKIIVPHTDIIWGKAEKGLGWLKGVATETVHEGDQYKIDGKGGEFQQQGWPKAELENCRIAYGKEFLEIEDSSLTLGGKSRITTTGKFNFGEHGEMKLAFGFHGCPVTPFLHGDLRSKFAGTFSGGTHITEALEEKSETRIEGAIEFAEASLKNVPGLGRVAAFTGHEEFRHPKLSELRGKYVSLGNTVEVSDLVAAMKGTARLEGHLTVKGESLRGRFELGLPSGIVEKFPGASEEVFTRKKGAFLWTTVTVSGTLKDPETDLKERLVKAAEAYFGKKILATILKPGKETIDVIRQLW